MFYNKDGQPTKFLNGVRTALPVHKPAETIEEKAAQPPSPSPKEIINRALDMLHTRAALYTAQRDRLAIAVMNLFEACPPYPDSPEQRALSRELSDALADINIKKDTNNAG